MNLDGTGSRSLHRPYPGSARLVQAVLGRITPVTAAELSSANLRRANLLLILGSHRPFSAAPLFQREPDERFFDALARAATSSRFAPARQPRAQQA